MNDDPFSNDRIRREFHTVEAMIACYCRGVHGTPGGLCGECRELRDYAAARLQRCPFGEAKPTCANCPIHCYQSQRRDQVKAVMRYAGPRMLWRHPILTARHWWDAWRRPPASRTPPV